VNKNEYLSALDSVLREMNVQDRADILAEYAEHFLRKAADGYSEEEIASRLASPKEIAQQFDELLHEKSEYERKDRFTSRIAKTIGIIFLDVISAPIYLMLWAWVIMLGGASIAFLGSGILTAIGIQSFTSSGIVLIPYMPLICRLLLSVAVLSLAVLCAIGAEYCRLYVIKLGRKYVRWHKNVFSKKGYALPSLPINPQLCPNKRRKMRNISLVTLVVFAVSFIAGLGSMMIASGSFEPWHIWEWFM